KVTRAQMSLATGRIVYSKTLSTTSGSLQASNCVRGGCDFRYNTYTEAGVAVAALDGSGEQVLTRGGYDTAPSFSPDGTRIAFLSHRADSSDGLAVMSPNGTGVVSLEPPAGFTDESPVWSPDGRTVAVVRAGPIGGRHDSEIALVPVDGGTP